MDIKAPFKIQINSNRSEVIANVFFFSRFFNFNLDISKFLNLSIYLYQLLNFKLAKK